VILDPESRADLAVAELLVSIALTATGSASRRR